MEQLGNVAGRCTWLIGKKIGKMIGSLSLYFHVFSWLIG
jgi:tetrahydromethanopterin S-methyltransferase subunit G